MRFFALLAAASAVSGCFHGPLPKAILPEAHAPIPDDTDRAKDGLRGPVQRVRTSSDGRFDRLDEYDRAGHVLHRVSARGLELWFRYDAHGKLIESVERSALLADTPERQKPFRNLSHEFDGRGRLLVETTFDRDARTTETLRITYDEQGRRAIETREQENPPRSKTRRFHYDQQGRVLEELEDDGTSVTFVRHESPTRVWRARYVRAKSDVQAETPECPWPGEIPLTPAQPEPPPPPGALKPLPGVMAILRLFGYQPGTPGESLFFATCELTVTDNRGFTLERTTPGSTSACWRYNAQGDEVVKEKRSRGPGCGWMVTVQTPHDATESKYDYDARGNWIGRVDLTTVVDFPSSHGRHELFFPLTEIMEHHHYHQTLQRAITYFPDQP